jgi:hypothetical protein
MEEEVMRRREERERFRAVHCRGVRCECVCVVESNPNLNLNLNPSGANFVRMCTSAIRDSVRSASERRRSAGETSAGLRAYLQAELLLIQCADEHVEKRRRIFRPRPSHARLFAASTARMCQTSRESERAGERASESERERELDRSKRKFPRT